MEFSFQLKNLNCQKEKHNESQMIGFCIDENCQEKNKFVCLDCLFEIHQKHKLVKLKDLNDIIENRYKNYKKKTEEENKLLEIYKKNEEFQLNKLKKFKNEVNKVLEVKIINFMNNLKKIYTDLCKNINNENKYLNIKEFENFFACNAAPTTKSELTKLSKICTNLYKEGYIKEEILEKKNDMNEKKQKKETDRGNSSIPLNISENENKMVLNSPLENFNKKLDEIIKEQLALMTKYIEENILVISDKCFSIPYKFEWCSKSYTGDGFLYELTNNNRIGTKILEDRIMTILRAKEEIKNNSIYNIKFKIGLKTEGDFDVGIGSEKEANTCWLRNSESISISNSGIRSLGIIMDNVSKLKDNDILDIEINTKEKVKYFKAILNNKLICMLDFEFDNAFIMAAMRNTGNYIEVLESKVSDFFI